MKNNFVYIICLFLLLSCGETPRSILIQHEDVFLREFLHHSIGFRSDLMIFEIYKEPKVNTYFLRLDGTEINLSGDSIQFNINDIPKYKKVNIVGKDQYAEGIKRIALRLSTLRSNAHVHSFTSQFYEFGVDLMLDIEGHKLFHVPDTLKITNPEWKNFLHQSEKIKEGWYAYEIPR